MKKNMETNKQWKRVPFSIELAMKIQSGEIEGRIVTSENLLVRIVDFNFKDKTDSIVYIGTYANGEQEFIQTCDNEGKSFGANVLFIELPEETPKHEFKAGDCVKVISGVFEGIRQFEFSEFIACFLKKQKNDAVIYDMKKLETIANQIEKKYPDIRIDTGKQSILRFVSQSDYITLKGNKITISNLSSLSMRCVIAHNLPSKTTQNIFTNTIIK